MTPIRGVATVAEAIANLSNGPTWFVGERLRESARRSGAMTRSEAVKVMLRHIGGLMDTKQHKEAAP